MLKDLIRASKDIIWQTALKRKIQQSVAYRKPISSTETRVKGWKKIYQASGPIKQAGVAILILDKVDFKPN
jgi:hypothetical protein